VITMPQTIQIFRPHGDTSGIRRAEITSRAVRVFEVPRSEVAEFLTMPEAGHVGLYFRFRAQELDNPDCYIGQSRNVGRRLAQDVTGKDFWARALVVVSSQTRGLTHM
jgi:hypothetical protein